MQNRPIKLITRYVVVGHINLMKYLHVLFVQYVMFRFVVYIVVVCSIYDVYCCCLHCYLLFNM